MRKTTPFDQSVTGFFFLGFAVLFFVLNPSVSAAQSKMLTVVVKEGQHVRDLAREYLNDPDLWTEILRVNDLDAVTDIRPGMELKIPASMITQADQELERSLRAIQEATSAGARFFAPETIIEAIRLRDEALKKRKSRDWEECIRQSTAARRSALQAMRESREKNDVSVEAILNDRRGTVQNRKQSDLIWHDAALYARLIETEKIRTLSQSLAEILFRDESRLRINENSQAVIQKMTYNLLENKQESTVSLVEGDIYALLAGSPRKKFNVAVPGVETKIDSTNFYVNKQKDSAMFANYQGEIEVSSKGASVVLGRNQGTRVLRDRAPSAPQKLLPAPELTAPAHLSRVFITSEKKEVLFTWNPVEGAVSYWVEIALERSTFQNIVLSQKNIRGSRFTVQDLEPGVYYWNVAAVDRFGFPGAKSQAKLVTVVSDDIPPYLIVESPKEGSIFQEGSILVVGETEGEAGLYLGGLPVQSKESGRFEYPLSLEEGLNRIELRAEDPAGNVSTLVRAVTYAPYREVRISHGTALKQVSPNHFITRSLGFTYTGQTEPDATIEVEALTEPFSARTFSDTLQGSFAISIPLVGEKNEFQISVTTPADYAAENRFTVETDLTPPQIRIDPEPSLIVTSENLNLTGLVTDGEVLFINGKEIGLEDGRFDETIPLAPGLNRIQFLASDFVGNTAYMEREILYDNRPPTLSKSEVSHKTVRGGERLAIVVFAEDESGLKKTARFTLRVGGWSLSDYMREVSGQSFYKTLINLPPDVRGKIRLVVELEDYHGNKREYSVME